MNTCIANELVAYLEGLRTDIAVTIPWELLHRWANATPLAVEHYAQLVRLWCDVWLQTSSASAPPVVHLYHTEAKLTLVRESTLDDPPAIALHDITGVESLAAPMPKFSKTGHRQTPPAQC